LKPGAKREFAKGEASAVRAGPKEICVSKFTVGKSHLPRNYKKILIIRVIFIKLTEIVLSFTLKLELKYFKYGG